MGFEPGFEIEVRSNEEGYQGAWFEAKVLKQLSKYQRYTIQYTTFVSESASNKLLEDTVHVSYVRPRPPKPSTSSRFEKHQMVEAMHNGAWWKGIVSEVICSKRSYRVCFPSSREEYEYEKEDVRAQMDWIKGDWVLSQDLKEDTGIKYSVGNCVEISMDKENYGAIWSAGTILKVIGKNYFLVQYDSIKENDDNDNVIYLEEIIDSQYIRTPPPSMLSLNKSFEVLAEVEAFQHGQWITTIILEVRPGLKYLVKSELQGEIELDQKDLRHKMELKNNKWVRFSKGKSSKCLVSIQVKPDGSSGPKRKSMDVKSMDVNVSKVDILGVEIGADESKPIKMSKNDTSLEAHLKLTDGIKSISNTQQNGKTNSFSPRSKPLFYRRRTSHPNVKAQSSNISNNKEADRSGTLISNSKILTAGEESFTVPTLEENESVVNAQHNSPSQLEIKTNLTEENNTKLISELTSQTANSRHTPVGQEAADTLLIADLDNYKACRGLTKNTDMQKKELDITAPELYINSSDAIAQENKTKCTRHKPTKSDYGNGIGNLSQPLLVAKRAEGCKSHKSKGHKTSEKYACLSSLDTITERRETDVHGIALPNQSSTNLTSHSTGITTANVSHICADSMQAGIMDDSPKNQLIEMNCEKNIIISDISENAAMMERTTSNPNASTNIEDSLPNKHSPTRSSLLKEVDINRESDQNSNIELPSGDTVSDRFIILPYIKKSPMWDIVESMDVFNTLPQTPHFHALEQYEPEFREGMAIGLMVTFANLVDSIKKMKITDTRYIFEEKLKALVPLEENGFDVQPVRSRLKKLLDIRDQAHISDRKKVDLKEKLRERDEEKDQLDMLIATQDKVIIELEDNLNCLRQKRESLVMRINKKDSERARLKVDFQATEDALVFAEDIFNAAIDSIW